MLYNQNDLPQASFSGANNNPLDLDDYANQNQFFVEEESKSPEVPADWHTIPKEEKKSNDYEAYPIIAPEADDIERASKQRYLTKEILNKGYDQ